jgi:uncharacterized membrane protein
MNKFTELISHRLSGVMTLLAVAGVGVSAYLMWGYTAPGATLACGSSGGCEAVKNSQYANLLGIPLPLFGIVSFCAILALLIIQYWKSDYLSAYSALAIFGIALAGGLYSAYLTYVELFVIYAICRWCVASAVIMVTLLILSVFNLRNQNQLC